jgi:MoxR-vWA-beta-propeller ternary system protein
LSPAEPRLGFAWRPRTRPLTPAAVSATGPASHALAARLLERDDEGLGRLRGVAGEGILAVLGEEEQLPWVDGAVYLGRDASSPALLLPTNREPLVPLPLLERAVLARLRDPYPPIALLATPPLILSAGLARPIHRGRLQTWLESQR